MSKKVGRPTAFNQKIADLICAEMAAGLSLRRITRKYHGKIPSRAAIYRWQLDNKGFRDQYAQAREALADFYFDECIDIADDGTNDTYIDEKGNTRTDHDVVHRSRLRVETRKWVCARMAPWKYFDKPDDGKAESEKPKWPEKLEIVEHPKPTEPKR